MATMLPTASSGGSAAPGTGSSSQDFLESVLPGVSKLTQSATGAIGDLLNGLPSVSQARTTNAYWGAGAGQPGGGDINSFIGQRGTDLYGQQAQQNRQTGLNDLMQTIGTYTSPALANQGQQMQNSQFGQNLAQNQNQFQQSQAQQQGEFNTQNQLDSFNSMLSALGLGNNITGQLPGNLTSF